MPKLEKPQTGEVPPDEPQEPELNTLIIENEALRRGFTIIPNYILRAPSVSFGAKLTYTLLLSYAWQEGSCFPGQERLAQNLGVSRQMVNKYLTELRAQGFVDWERRGLGKTNVYRILDIKPEPHPNSKLSTDEKLSIARAADSGQTTPDVNYTLHQDVNQPKNAELTADVKLALHPDDKPALHPVVKPALHKEYSVEKDSEYKTQMLSKFRKASTPAKKGKNAPSGQAAPDQRVQVAPAQTRASTQPESAKQTRPTQQQSDYSEDIEAIVNDFTKLVLHDAEHLQANTTQALNLWRESALTEEDFIDLLYAAKEITLKRSASIKKRVGDLGLKNRAPYFFEVVKDLITQKQINGLSG